LNFCFLLSCWMCYWCKSCINLLCHRFRVWSWCAPGLLAHAVLGFRVWSLELLPFFCIQISTSKYLQVKLFCFRGCSQDQSVSWSRTCIIYCFFLFFLLRIDEWMCRQ
jgi:hypothetical protein